MHGCVSPHRFGMSAHTYTRGSWTTPEAAHPDRDVPSTDYGKQYASLVGGPV